MTLRPVHLLAAAWLALGCGTASAQQPLPAVSDADVPVESRSNADSFRIERDRPNIARDYVQQPPLVPHAIANYRVTKNFNQCMDCHSWSRYQEKNATKVSVSHFKTRDGAELSNISPRRYFCTQCHVAQTEAAPLVDNVFRRAEGLRR